MIGLLAHTQTPRPRKRVENWFSFQTEQANERYAKTSREFDEALRRLEAALERFDSEATNLQQVRDDLRGQR